MRVGRGEFAFLTGPSGAGKTTLLRILLRQEVPTAGRVVVDGRDLAALGPADVQRYRRTVGFVFQDFKLIPRKTVFENVIFALRILGVPDVQQRRRTFQVLKWVGLQHRANAYPMELSGGEQQRVAIARALVNEPVLVLADEPTGNLDPDLALEIMNLFREMNAGGTTVLVATHDRELIHHVGRRTIALDHGSRDGVGMNRREPAMIAGLTYFVTEAWLSLWRGRGAASCRCSRSPSRRSCSACSCSWRATCSAPSTNGAGRPSCRSTFATSATDERAGRRPRAPFAPTPLGRRRRIRVEGRTRSRGSGRTSRTWRRPIDSAADNPLPASFEVRLGVRPVRRRRSNDCRPACRGCRAWPTCGTTGGGSTGWCRSEPSCAGPACCWPRCSCWRPRSR